MIGCVCVSGALFFMCVLVTDMFLGRFSWEPVESFPVAAIQQAIDHCLQSLDPVRICIHANKRRSCHGMYIDWMNALCKSVDIEIIL